MACAFAPTVSSLQGDRAGCTRAPKGLLLRPLPSSSRVATPPESIDNLSFVNLRPPPHSGANRCDSWQIAANREHIRAVRADGRPPESPCTTPAGVYIHPQTAASRCTAFPTSSAMRTLPAVFALALFALVACTDDDSTSSGADTGADAGTDLGADASAEADGCDRVETITICNCVAGECYDEFCGDCSCTPDDPRYVEAVNGIDAHWCDRDVRVACDFEEHPAFIPGNISDGESEQCYFNEFGLFPF